MYWGTSGVVTPTAMFVERAAAADAENVPIDLWLSISWARLDDGRMEIVTHGLTEFGHPDLGRRSDDADEAAERMVRMVREGAILAGDGQRLETRIDTICVHGDSAAAVALSGAVRQGLESAGIAVRAFDGRPLA